MRIAIFGGSGGLGSQLANYLSYDNGDRCHAVTALGSKDVDVTDPTSVEKFFKDSPTDVVINMAAVNHDAMLHKTDPVAVSHQIDVNVKGTLNILRHALPGMRERKFGRIILTSSVLSRCPVAGTGVYSGCKAFIDNLTKTCALENAKYGITCNSLVLGYSDGGLAHRIPKSILDGIVGAIPLRRLCRVEEIYKAVSFLMDTEYATGTNLVLTGGII